MQIKHEAQKLLTALLACDRRIPQVDIQKIEESLILFRKQFHEQPGRFIWYDSVADFNRGTYFSKTAFEAIIDRSYEGYSYENLISREKLILKLRKYDLSIINKRFLLQKYLALFLSLVQKNEDYRQFKPLFDAYLEGLYAVRLTGETTHCLKRPVLYIKNNKLHRITGPAVIYEKEKYYYFMGHRISKKYLNNSKKVPSRFQKQLLLARLGIRHFLADTEMYNLVENLGHSFALKYRKYLVRGLTEEQVELYDNCWAMKKLTS